MAAPGAMLAYALFGTSRQLVVSATTATSAVSAATVGPLAHGDPARFAALSAALAIVVARRAGRRGRAAARGDRRLRLQAGDDRLPLRAGDGDRARAAAEPARGPARRGELLPARCATCSASSTTSTATTLAVGVGSLAVLLLGRRLRAALPVDAAGARARRSRSRRCWTSHDHGVARRRRHPGRAARPGDPRRRRRRHRQAHHAGPRRADHERRGGRRRAPLAVKHGYRVDAQPRPDGLGRRQPPGRPLVGVRPVGRRQPDRRGRRRRRAQAAGRVDLRPGLLLLTGAFLAPLFEDLPEATLGGDRDRRRVGLLRRRRAAPLRPRAAQRDRLRRRSSARRRARPRRAAGPRRRRRAVAGLRRPAAEPAVGRRAGARSAPPGPGAGWTATRAGARPTARWWCAATACCSTPTPNSVQGTRARGWSPTPIRGRDLGRARPVDLDATSTSRPPTCSTSLPSSSRARTSSCASRRSARRGARLLDRAGCQLTGCRSPRRSDDALADDADR